MSLVKEFKAFAVKGNIIDLAVAVIIGAAFGKIVTAVVSDLIMPLIGAIMPGDAGWRTFTVTPLDIPVGHFIGEVVNFLIVAFVLFLVVVKLIGRLKRKEGPAAPTTKACTECLEQIPVAARRCRACTSVVAA